MADNVTAPVLHRVPPEGVGTAATGFMVAVIALLGVLSHVPLLNVTKYEVVAEIEGVV